MLITHPKNKNLLIYLINFNYKDLNKIRKKWPSVAQILHVKGKHQDNQLQDKESK